MFLWIGLLIGLTSSLLSPYVSRLHATGYWAGKALISPDLASVSPRGLQDPLTAGWPSSLCFWIGLLPYAAAGLAFIHDWWAGIVVYVITLFISVFTERTAVAPRTIDYYLMTLGQHAYRRGVDYKVNGHMDKSEAAIELAADVAELLGIYQNSGVKVPSLREVRKAPHGDKMYLWQQHKNALSMDVGH